MVNTIELDGALPPDGTPRHFQRHTVISVILRGTTLPPGKDYEEAEQLANYLARQVMDGATALSLFTMAYLDFPEITADEQRLIDAERDVFLAERAAHWRSEKPSAPQTVIDAYAKNDLIASIVAGGEWPHDYQMRAQFMHVKSFIYALAGIRSALALLAKRPAVSDQASAALAQVDAHLPSLMDIRNSLAHSDERVLGLKTGGKEIVGQPLQASWGGVNGSVIVPEMLEGTLFRTTIADGSHPTIDIHEDTFLPVGRIVQEFLHSLPWSGDVRVLPKLRGHDKPLPPGPLNYEGRSYSN